MAARRGESTSPESLLLTGARQESDCRGPPYGLQENETGVPASASWVLNQKHVAGPPGLHRSWGIECFHLQDLLTPQASRAPLTDGETEAQKEKLAEPRGPTV